ncbi:MAG: endolytic transglycosylase MltG [Candidatus Binatia bacterium]|nr:endolytic transglycosylase MltG [Candidatus Binatia bacterium]
MKRIFIFSVLVVLTGLGLGLWYGYTWLTTPSPIPSHGVLIAVPEGATLSATARALAEQGVITNARLFSWWARLTGDDRKIKSGEYAFTAPLSPLAVLRLLVEGKAIRVTVTVTEGMTFKQLVRVLAQKGLGAEEHFFCLATDPVFLATWGLPPQGIEGYLFPATYAFSPFAPPEEILGQMVRRFYRALSPAMYRQMDLHGLSLHEAVTLASLIEKETHLGAERPLVAAVFHNRLRRKMPLQCDPSVIYGLEEFDGNLTRQHLLTPTLYNTYLFHGLPPGPIASPSVESLLAALNPAPADYLYFVARGDGSHEFSSDLAAHNRAVARFQRKRF